MSHPMEGKDRIVPVTVFIREFSPDGWEVWVKDYSHKVAGSFEFCMHKVYQRIRTHVVPVGAPFKITLEWVS